MSDNSIRNRYIQAVEDDDSIDAQEENEETAPYIAFVLGGKGNRSENAIAIHYQDGIFKEILFYNYIMRVFGTTDSHVEIFSTEGVYSIEGQNLTQLIELIQDKKLRAMHGYNAELYPDRPPANAPLILSIGYSNNEDYREFQRRRDEVRPPE